MDSMPAHLRLRELAARRPALAIGLMSGTSADSVDAALVKIGAAPDRPLELADYLQLPVPDDLRQHVLGASEGRATTPLICQLNFEIAETFARAALDLMKRNHIGPDRLDFIASHGQTVHHIPRADPARGWRAPSTLQLGDPCVIAERTGVTTVGNFRTRDMAAGGQGAPLVPFFDAFFFGREDRDLICLNLGGIANYTLVEANGGVLAFDSGPGNMVMDALAQQLAPPARFDRGGRIAAKGRVIQPLLEWCLTHPYFELPPPKSTGREDFGEPFVQQFLHQAPAGTPPENLLATAAELTARSVADSLERFVRPRANPTLAAASGGGTYNQHLMNRLAALTPYLEWKTTGDFGLPPAAKEAAAFAVLGYATLADVPANTPNATGATRARILGVIAPGNRPPESPRNEEYGAHGCARNETHPRPRNAALERNTPPRAHRIRPQD